MKPTIIAKLSKSLFYDAGDKRVNGETSQWLRPSGWRCGVPADVIWVPQLQKLAAGLLKSLVTTRCWPGSSYRPSPSNVSEPNCVSLKNSPFPSSVFLWSLHSTRVYTPTLPFSESFGGLKWRNLCLYKCRDETQVSSQPTWVNKRRLHAAAPAAEKQRGHERQSDTSKVHLPRRINTADGLGMKNTLIYSAISWDGRAAAFLEVLWEVKLAPRTGAEWHRLFTNVKKQTKKKNKKGMYPFVSRTNVPSKTHAWPLRAHRTGRSGRKVAVAWVWQRL